MVSQRASRPSHDVSEVTLGGSWSKLGGSHQPEPMSDQSTVVSVPPLLTVT